MRKVERLIVWIICLHKLIVNCGEVFRTCCPLFGKNAACKARSVSLLFVNLQHIRWWLVRWDVNNGVRYKHKEPDRWWLGQRQRFIFFFSVLVSYCSSLPYCKMTSSMVFPSHCFLLISYHKILSLFSRYFLRVFWRVIYIANNRCWSKYTI